MRAKQQLKMRTHTATGTVAATVIFLHVPEANALRRVNFYVASGPSAMIIANLSASTPMAHRSLPVLKNKAGFVSLTDGRSLLPFRTSTRGRTSCSSLISMIDVMAPPVCRSTSWPGRVQRNDFVYLRRCYCDRRAAELCLGDRSNEDMTMSNARAIDNTIPSADIVKRAARLGAEIRNVRLSGDLADETIQAINQLLREHKVILPRSGTSGRCRAGAFRRQARQARRASDRRRDHGHVVHSGAGFRSWRRPCGSMAYGRHLRGRLSEDLGAARRGHSALRR